MVVNDGCDSIGYPAIDTCTVAPLFENDAALFLNIFGQNLDKGLVLDGFKLKVVKIGEGGYSINDILTHDAHEQDSTLHTMLAMMDGENLPMAMGVIRDVEAPTYDEAVHAQIAEVQAKNPTRKLRELFLQQDIWEVK